MTNSTYRTLLDNQVVQLKELLEVRHSVFVLGNAGSGKSKVWNTLQRTYKNLGQKPTAADLDPKAVTNDELFGVINPATREWKDGELLFLLLLILSLVNIIYHCSARFSGTSSHDAIVCIDFYAEHIPHRRCIIPTGLFSVIMR